MELYYITYITQYVNSLYYFRSAKVKMKFTKRDQFSVPTSNPDSLIAGSDGVGINVHSIVLSISSPFMNSILRSLDDPTEAMFVLPQCEGSDIQAVVSILYGFEDSVWVDGDLLDMLGLSAFKNVFMEVHTQGTDVVPVQGTEVVPVQGTE